MGHPTSLVYTHAEGNIWIINIIIYPTCIDPSDKHNNLQKKMCKPFQNHAKFAQGILMCGIEVSDALNHTRMGVFMKNIARPRMPICRVIKISDHTKC
jgi:hypothetical protein